MKQTLKDLEILQKYLSEEELKEIAKSVAYESFKSSIGSYNSQNRESNYEWYLKHGALEAVREHISEFDAQALVGDLQDKTKKLIKSLATYDLPDNYKTIAEEYIENNKSIIEDKMKSHITDFVNNEKEFSYGGAYTTFKEYIGQQMTDIIYNLFEQYFKKK